MIGNNGIESGAAKLSLCGAAALVDPPGWHLFRYELTAEQLKRVRGERVRLLLATEFSTSSNGPPQAARPGFFLDNVGVWPG